MAQLKKEQCGTCRFALEVSEVEVECHLRAPSPSSSPDTEGDTYWPVVRIHDFCGSWRAYSDQEPNVSAGLFHVAHAMGTLIHGTGRDWPHKSEIVADLQAALDALDPSRKDPEDPA